MKMLPVRITDSLQNLLLDFRLNRENTEDFPLPWISLEAALASATKTYETVPSTERMHSMTIEQEAIRRFCLHLINERNNKELMRHN